MAPKDLLDICAVWILEVFRTLSVYQTRHCCEIIALTLVVVQHLFDL